MTNPALRPDGTLARFELRSELGRGAQASVWLAFDPRMEREVAIKILHTPAGTDGQVVAQWLQEARNAGRVVHPNIVALHEADIHDNQPYLVFEYVAGRTLSRYVQELGALPAAQAVTLMVDVMQAVVAAHAAGVVHCDLKPSNVIVDAAGRARVMDFGIAVRLQPDVAVQAGAGGTVGYMAPEASNGAAPTAAMDIFSAGMVLAEMLLGKPLVQEKDPYRAIHRIANEPLQLPVGMAADVNEALHAMVSRALAKDPAQRFANAEAFLQALQDWLKPSLNTGGAATAFKSGTGALEFLMRRMRHKSDFPALSDAVVRIQSMAVSETESVNSVTNEVLKDVALTNKLLRMVNSAHYGRGGTISTVSRAVTLVGFNGIRNMALSLVLLEHMQDKAHAGQLKEEFLRSLMAGSIGAELCPVAKESEEAFIGAMFQNLGRLLVQYYFPEEATQVRHLVQQPRQPLDEASASRQVLGMSYEDLGVGIAKDWGLPIPIQRCMSKPTGKPPSTADADAGERLRWVALAANEISDVLLTSKPQELEARLVEVTRKYAGAVGMSAKNVQAATAVARNKLIELAKAMEITVSPRSAAANLLKSPDAAAGAGASPEVGLSSLALQATQTTAVPAEGAVTTLVADTLAAGIQDITNAMVDDFKLVDVLRMILETMFRAMEFDRVIFCMRDNKTEMMTGRFGLGKGVEQTAKVFRSFLKATPPDLFAAVCANGVDTMISDATAARIAQRLPDWYRQHVNAPTFLLLPLQIKGAPFGLIYADKLKPGTLELNEKELSLLRTLRNQAVMAFKQSS